MRYAVAILLSCVLFHPRLTSAAALFDGNLNTTPSDQGWRFLQQPLLGHSVTQVTLPDGILLDTTDPISDRGGYFSKDPLFGFSALPDPPQLDRHAGFSIEFSLRIDFENHTTGAAGDDNQDGAADRAGFSMIAIASDLRGVELSFWQDSVWIQDDDQNGTASLFTQAESVSRDTTEAMTAYELQIFGERYRLLAEGNRLPILSGRIRDYRRFAGPIDPYETENFLFFGDNTTRGESRVEIAAIAAGNLNTACNEVDAMVSNLANGTSELRNDLNADGIVDSQDLETWLSVAGEFYSTDGDAFRFGDANLDGFVDGSDFNVWNDHRSMDGQGWCGGDFDANGTTDADDLAIWKTNAFHTTTPPANVPEPIGNTTILVVMALGIARKNRRNNAPVNAPTTNAPRKANERLHSAFSSPVPVRWPSKAVDVRRSTARHVQAVDPSAQPNQRNRMSVSR